jgi:hypothetical protein
VAVVCDPPGPCQEAGVCDPASGKCTYAPKPQGTVCRKAGDQCQEDAVCDGTAAGCPPNPVAVGRACDDGNRCTVGAVCQADGSCAGTAKDCDDGLSCTDDICDPQFGCSHPVKPGFCLIDGACYADGDRNPANPCQGCDASFPGLSTIWTSVGRGLPCADGDPCDGAEACDGEGHCLAGVPVSCPPCRACNPATGACDADPGATGLCDTGSLCARDAHCADGVCQPSQIVLCGPPPDDCHLEGTCNPATGTCEYPAKPDGEACTSGDRCVTEATCRAGVCTGGSPVVCPQPPEFCQQAVCDPATGACVVTPVPNGHSDRRGCLVCPGCLFGRCPVPTTPIDCGGELNPCRTCDPATGTCVPVPSGTDCGSTCTASATCDEQGNCIGRPAFGCANVGECPARVCDSETGKCVETGTKDGQPCGLDKCHVCQHGACVPKKCDDCQSCDPASGECRTCDPCCRGVCGMEPCDNVCCDPGYTCNPFAHNTCNFCPDARICNHRCHATPVFPCEGQCFATPGQCCGRNVFGEILVCGLDQTCCPQVVIGPACCDLGQVCGPLGCARAG